MRSGMSAFGPKRTCAGALQMSAFGGQADNGKAISRTYRCGAMTFCNFQALALVGKKRRGKQWGKQIGDSAESPAMARRKLTAVRFIGFDRHRSAGRGAALRRARHARARRYPQRGATAAR